jgi:phosphatidylglycerophosphatase A
MDRIIVAIATGLYSGKMVKAPGTWGSAFAMIPWYFCRNLSFANYLILLLVLLLVGTLAAGSAEKIFDQPDPGCIVIDEIAGIFIALTLAPKHPLAWVLGFLLFRLFDIWKPFPVSWLDAHLHGGIGIMMDDVAAGIYSLISLQLIWLVVEKLV